MKNKSAEIICKILYYILAFKVLNFLLMHIIYIIGINLIVFADITMSYDFKVALRLILNILILVKFLNYNKVFKVTKEN